MADIVTRGTRLRGLARRQSAGKGPVREFLAVTLAGGYAQRPADTVAIHVNTLRAAAVVYA